MKDIETWNYFLKNKSAITHPFDRDFVWVTEEVFNKVKEDFYSELNIIHSGKSFRSSGYLKHIHAVIQDKYVFVHIDTGNIARFFPLGIAHFLMDVVPYIYFAIKERRSLKSLFDYPCI